MKKKIKIKTGYSTKEIARLLVDNGEVCVVGVGLITLKDAEANYPKEVDGELIQEKVNTKRLSISRSALLKRETQNLINVDKKNK